MPPSPMSPQDRAIIAGAELLAEEARVKGVLCGIDKNIASVDMLEQALAVAWSDVFMFMGANDTKERKRETIKVACGRFAKLIERQMKLRAGHNPQAHIIGKGR